MDKVAKCGVMDNILSFAAFKNQKELKKSDGAKRSRLTGKSPSAALAFLLDNPRPPYAHFCPI